jgi:acetylornithine deacetylase/succinyl-diaminopimelate desuccinylase-like protein
MEITVSGPKRNLHSGVDGGVIREPMLDMVSLLSTLTTADGTISIAGVYDSVRPLSDQEQALYQSIPDFDPKHYQKTLGVELPTDDAAQLLMKRWRQPVLSIHNITSGNSIKSSIIPAKVVARVGMRLVPDQNADHICELFTRHIKDKVRTLSLTDSLTHSLTYTD